MKYLNQLIFVILLFTVYISSETEAKVHQLHPGIKIPIQPEYSVDNVEIFCYPGRTKYLAHIWQTLYFRITSKSNYEFYEGATAEEVLTEHEAQRSSWRFSFWTTKSQNAKIDPFKPCCIGIQSRQPYVIELQVLRIDYWKVLLLIFGVILYLSAAKLSRNSLFYYIVGVTIGVCASFLLLVYFVSKIIPRKPLMYGFLAGGWAVSVYLFQMLFDNLRTTLALYQTYIMYYMLGTGVLSFAICYRRGPPTDQRSQNLIKWTLMFIGLTSIYWSSQFTEAVMGIIVLLVLGYNFPRLWILKTRTLWKRRFPPKASLLSNEEYYQQGVKETCKALDELRAYCSSPKCNQWKTVLKLKDAKRFASFIEGESHLSDDEIIEYENEQTGYNYEEDEINFSDDEDL